MFLRNKMKREAAKRHVVMARRVADGIITYAKSWHPHEGILILQGKIKKEEIILEGLIIPPFSLHGPYYSGFSGYELPFDLSYIGTAHSHPGGSNKPSREDLNNYYGLVSIIISYPYEDNTIGAFDRNGKNMEIKLLSSGTV
jgi:proteasome lid subunit RPN8/RPN11